MSYTAPNAVNARLFAAFVISFIARGLYSHTNHKICYSAVSSGGIVLTLPGFAVSECVLSAGQGGTQLIRSQCQQLWN